MMRTTLDAAICRGFYLSARNTEHQFVRQLGSHVIVVARGLENYWERFVFVKEAMHLFDDPTEATDSGEDFDQQLAELMGVSSPERRSPQMTSEIKCFWMALCALCPEETRSEFERERGQGEIDDFTIGLQLRIPERYVQYLFHISYNEIRDFLIR